MASVQAVDVRASFLFTGYFEWPSSGVGSTTTRRGWVLHGVETFDFATVSGCDQLVVGPANARGGTLDFLMTDVPDVVWIAVVAPAGNSVTPICWQSFRWLRWF